MTLDAFLNSHEKITSLTFEEFDPYIKGLEQQKELAARTNKLDWQNELITSIEHCKTIKSCLHLFNLKKDIENGKPGASQFAVGMTQLEAQLKLRGIDTEASYTKWKETGKFSL